MTLTLPSEAASAHADDVVRAQLEAAREVLSGIPARLVEVSTDVLADVAAAAAAMLASAEAARAAVVLEASSRGAVAGSDHPRVNRWVEQSCRDANVPVTRAHARHLQDVATTCAGVDVSALREAVVSGRLPMESAATVAKVFRRIRARIDYPNWDALLEALVDWAAAGALPRELSALEDALIGQYGLPDALDDEHTRLHSRRELTGFARDRNGMLCATIRLDPASEARFTAAIHALSAPRADADGTPDERPVGMRRADALLTLAGLATVPDPAVSGSGVKARVMVTVPLATLTAGLDAAKPDTADAQGAPAGERGYATTGFGQALSPTQARLLACDAQIIPAVLGSSGELLDLGRARRLISPGQRAALNLRDQGCTYPGCNTPPAWCDGHHLIHWSLGGPTDLGNLALLCAHHHTQVHRWRHEGRVTPDGVVWCRDDGTAIGNAPRTQVDRRRPSRLRRGDDA